jgi:hypothetical protein
MSKRLLMMACGLTAANYLYQAMTGHDWPVALDRSFFQAAALFFVWLALRLERSPQDTTTTPQTKDN